MICKCIPRVSYAHIGGSATWNSEFPEEIKYPGAIVLEKIFSSRHHLEFQPQ